MDGMTINHIVSIDHGSYTNKNRGNDEWWDDQKNHSQPCNLTMDGTCGDGQKPWGFFGSLVTV